MFSPVLWKHYRNVKLTGSGTIASGSEANYTIRIKGSTNVDDVDYVIVTIDKDVIVTGDRYAAFITHNSNHAYGVVVNIKGTLIGGIGNSPGYTYPAFYINGRVQDKENYPVVNIDGATLRGEGGMYIAGYAKWNIKNTYIEGQSYGVAIKSGILNLKDSNVLCNGPDDTPTQGHSNGVNASGTTIQIESNKGYAGDIQVSIDGGTYTSQNGVVLYEYLDDGTTETKVNSIDIKGGTFTAGEGKGIVMTSQEFSNVITKFISGGMFNSDVTTYVKDTSIIRKLSENSYIVGISYKVNISAMNNGSVSANKISGLANDEIKLTITPNEGYALVNVIVKDVNNNEISVADNKFRLPNSDVTVSASFAKVEIPTVNTTETPKTEVIGVSNSDETSQILLDSLSESTTFANGTAVSLDINKIEATDNDIAQVTKALDEKNLKNAVIGNFYDISVNVKEEDDVIGTLAELKNAIELIVVLPESLTNVPSGYIRTYYIVRNHNGVMEVLDTKLSDDKKSLTFKSDKFSTYALAYADSVNNEIANPNTVDNIAYYNVLLGISLIGLIGIG